MKLALFKGCAEKYRFHRMFFFAMRTNSKVFLPEIDTNSKVNGMFLRLFGEEVVSKQSKVSGTARTSTKRQHKRACPSAQESTWQTPGFRARQAFFVYACSVIWASINGNTHPGSCLHHEINRNQSLFPKSMSETSISISSLIVFSIKLLLNQKACFVNVVIPVFLSGTGRAI